MSQNLNFAIEELEELEAPCVECFAAGFAAGAGAVGIGLLIT